MRRYSGDDGDFETSEVPFETAEELEDAGDDSDSADLNEELDHSGSNSRPEPSGSGDAFPTSNILMYCWRAMREVALSWATLALKLPATDESVETLTTMGNCLVDLVLACRHRGAVETLASALEVLCHR